MSNMKMVSLIDAENRAQTVEIETELEAALKSVNTEIKHLRKDVDELLLRIVNHRAKPVI